MNETRLPGYVKAIGPGILMAGAAIGVSHLVQSTRAGAEYGLALIGLVIFVNLIKYPFFEYGHRYAVARDESLLHGYKRMGKAFLWIYVVLNAVSSIGATAGTTLVTAALFKTVVDTSLSVSAISAIIITVCALIVLIGRFRALDVTVKVVMGVMVVATVAAFVMTLINGPVGDLGQRSISPWTLAALPFLVALIGWMPAPIEMSVWQSLWVGANDKAKNHKSIRPQAFLDFNIGYIGTMLLAVMFIVMGAYVIYGSGVTLSANAAEFAGQLIDLFALNLGEWSRPIISISAVTCMFSTVLTVVDVYPRTFAVSHRLLTDRDNEDVRFWHIVYMVSVGVVSIIFLFYIGGSIRTLLDIATTIAFFAAPFLAFLNFRLVTGKEMPDEMKPSLLYRVVSIVGIAFLGIMALMFLYVRFFYQGS